MSVRQDPPSLARPAEYGVPESGAEETFLALDLAARDAIVIAVSGGSDSLALLLLVAGHLWRLGSPTRLLAVTVDHALRPGSADEARAVARLCEERGIAHRTMRWEGAKPQTGLMAAARLARYRLLAEAAGAAGAGLILTGHTADDQAETIAMRAERSGVGGRGAAGMAAATLYQDRHWIARPLLGLARGDLRAMLRRRGVAWIDDPTNLDTRYERSRVRRHLGSNGSAPGGGAPRREAEARAAGEYVARHMRLAAPGLVRIDDAFFAACDAPALLAFRMALAIVGGRAHLPGEAAARELFARLPQGQCRATLSRTLVEARAGAVWMHREHRGLTALPASADMLWDGRFRVVGPARPEITVGPMDAIDAAACTPRADAPARLVRAALAAEPALFQGGSHLVDGTVPGVRRERVLAPWATFLPGFDHAAAVAFRTLFDLAPLPAPPWRDHIGR